jgi:hypothetical protein
LRAVGSESGRGPLQVISGDEGVPALNVPQLAHHGEALIAAWTAEQDGRTVIRSARMVRDEAETADQQ